MIDFKQYLINQLDEKVKLTHLEHPEDLLIISGHQGGLDALDFLRTNTEALKGNSSVVVQGKMDGAPAIIAGINPENNKFFVATKSLFNKTPKINYTHDDITNNHSGGVVDKLRVALDHLPSLGFKGILQGDMLFDKSLVKKETIHGVKYITFRPNTITYAVPADSDLAKDILKAKIGMAWHTTYVGKTIADLGAEFRIDISTHVKTSVVFNTDTNLDLKDVYLSDSSYKSIMKSIDDLGKELSKFNKEELEYLSSHSTEILTYINSKVREGETVSKSMVKGLFDFINKKYDKAKDKLKSEKGKEKKEAQKLEKSTDIRKVAGTLWYVLEFHQEIQFIKIKLVKHLEKLGRYKEFIETDKGYDVTTPEGFVAISMKGAVKLVDRLEFSANNFNIMKKWSK